jgi:diguanylate cyclase (GGDEF)-like protein
VSEDNNNNNSKQAEITELKKQLYDREAEIELLKTTFSEIGSELDLEKVFQIVAERARELISAETVLIPILDDDCEMYTYRGGSGKNAPEIVGESLPYNSGVCGWVWTHKRPWWRGVLDELSDEDRNIWEKEAGSLILVPLVGREHFLGGIAGMNKLNGSDFDRCDLNLLSIFASTVAIVIENAMTFQKLEMSNQTMSDYQLHQEKLNKQLKDSSRELEYLSLYDPLTALPNRSLFRDRLMQHISHASIQQENIGLLLVDLDNFKEINDTLGHENGDHLLNLIGKRFSKDLLPDETLSRLGGDEFVFILPQKDQRQSLKRGYELLELLNASFKINNTEIAISASVGVSVYPEHGEDVSTLLRHTDSAMYHAKDAKLGIHIYDSDVDKKSTGQLKITTDIYKALDENDFELYYQPKIQLKDDKLISVEALGRWEHSEQGFIPPNIFIDVLEQTGLIDRYTEWAIKTALAQISTWREKGYEIKIAVNISTITLNHAGFINFLKETIIDSDTGSNLIFEITENLFLAEYDRLSETLQMIRELGIVLSIDDFGTGYSSLSRLKKLPVSELKIDCSFVMEMIKDPDDEVIVKSTIDLSHNLGLTVVAEGVENKKTYDRLKELGCDTIQGYFISKPLPVKLFNEFLSSRK